MQGEIAILLILNDFALDGEVARVPFAQGKVHESGHNDIVNSESNIAQSNLMIGLKQGQVIN